MDSFVQRHASVVTGVLTGFDRLRFRGTLRWLNCDDGMGKYLNKMGILLKNFDQFVTRVTGELKDATRRVAEAAGRPVKYLASSSASKENQARAIAKRDGIQEGLICVLSCVEPCWSFGLTRDPRARRLELRRSYRKCLHYYFYLHHPRLGFMHLRLQSWFPFGVHVCLNGREWLARELDRLGLGYARLDNCFVHLADVRRIQRQMNLQLRMNWRSFLDGIVAQVHPMHAKLFPVTPYYWSVDQSEWATDIMFRSSSELTRLYPRLIQHAMQNLGSREVMRFLGRRVPLAGGIPRNFNGEVVSDLRCRPEGMRVKHQVCGNSVKMYNKQGSVLRVETTINNPRDLKVYRQTEGQPRSRPRWQRLRKGVVDMRRRAEISQAANQRYLESMAVVEDATPLGQLAESLCRRVRWKGRSVRAINPLAAADAKLLEAVSRGEFLVNGFRNRDLRALLYGSKRIDPNRQKLQAAAVTRQLRMLRAHGLIRKVPKTHRYVLSDIGRAAITALLTARAADTKKLMTAA